MTQHEYEELIRFRKKECNLNGFNAMEVSVREIREICGSPKKDAGVIAEALMQCMLEGDSFLNEDRNSDTFAVVYYCDNLSDSRRKMF